MTTAGKKVLHGLKCETVHEVEGAGTIGSAGIVAQIEVVAIRKCLSQPFENGQAAIARVEDSYGTRDVICPGN